MEKKENQFPLKETSLKATFMKNKENYASNDTNEKERTVKK